MKNVFIMFLFFFFSTTVFAENVVSFDSASEMSYGTGCQSAGGINVLESEVFSMQDGYLLMDTVSPATSIVNAEYQIFDEPDPSKSWKYEAHVKEIETEPSGGFIQGFGLAVKVNGFLHRIALGDGVLYGFDSTTSAQATGDDFHTYTMLGSPDSTSYDVYRDGLLIFTETARPTTPGSRIGFGDTTCHGGNSKFLIDWVNPSSWLFQS